MARLATATQIVERVAGEVGLYVTDPVLFTSKDPNMQQLFILLRSACAELVELHPWQILKEQHQILTSSADSGVYELPDDFGYMVDQTGWEYTNRMALGGPLSSQEWAYLAGRDLVSNTIYASFRQVDNKFEIYPQPVPDGLNINFEYISRNYSSTDAARTETFDDITDGAQFIGFDPILIQKFLKCKFLEAKGFDASSARVEFENMLGSRTGKDTGGAVLNAGGARGRFPYIDPIRNTRDTGYGVL